MQVLTGLAILISGFSTLNTSLTTYHWEILVSIAWFSSVTHLSALTFLRNHLYNHQAKRLRIVFTSGVVVLMLIVALVPTGYGNINEYPAIPALCNLISPDHFAIKEEGTEAMDIMISAMFLILVSYVMRVFKLFRPLSEWMSSVFKGKMGRCGRRPVDWLYRRSTKRGKDGKVGFGRRLLFYLLFRPVLAGAILIKLTFDFISSMAFEVQPIPKHHSLTDYSQVHWVAFSATWGTIRVVWLKNMIFEDIEETDRTRSADPLGAPRIMYSPDTMEWSFGQVPAVTMLVAPLKSIHERFYEYRLARKRIKEGGGEMGRRWSGVLLISDSFDNGSGIDCRGAYHWQSCSYGCYSESESESNGSAHDFHWSTPNHAHDSIHITHSPRPSRSKRPFSLPRKPNSLPQPNSITLPTLPTSIFLRHHLAPLPRLLRFEMAHPSNHPLQPHRPHLRRPLPQHPRRL